MNDGRSGRVGPRRGDLQLREVHLAQPEVGARVERAPVGDLPGLGEQPPRSAVGVTETGQPDDLLGDLVHLLAGLEEALGVGPVDMTPVEGDQAAGGVEDVDGRGVEAVGVAHGVGQHRAEPGAAGEAGHPGGVGRRAGTPDGAVSRGAGGRPARRGGSRRGPPRATAPGPPGRGRRDDGPRPHRARRPDRAAPRRRRSRARARGRTGRPPAPALAGEVDRGDHPAHRRPARSPRVARVGQEGHPRHQPVVTERATAHRGARPLLRRRGLPHQGPDREVDAQHRPDTCFRHAFACFTAP